MSTETNVYDKTIIIQNGSKDGCFARVSTFDNGECLLMFGNPVGSAHYRMTWGELQALCNAGLESLAALSAHEAQVKKDEAGAEAAS